MESNLGQTQQKLVSQHSIPPKKSNKKLIGAIIGIIIIIIVIFLVFFLFFADNSDKFYGKWNVDSTSMMGFSKEIDNMTIDFKEDESYEIIYDELSWEGSWNLDGDKIYLTTKDPDADESDVRIDNNPLGYNYEFSNGNSKLKLYLNMMIAEGEFILTR